MNFQETIRKSHFAEADVAEKMYLVKEPTGKTANQLLDMLSGLNLSAVQIKGCLDYARYLVDFRAQLPMEK